MAMPIPVRLVPDTSRRDWTVEELQLPPDDGTRYEIIDRELLVTAAPNLMHRVALRELVRLLIPAAGAAGLDLFFAPTAGRVIERWRVGEEHPDILTDSIAWQPRQGQDALAIDLEARFRRVRAQE